MIDFNLHIQIEDYINGSLNDADRVLFEERLKTDTELQEAVNSYQLVNEVIIDNELLKIKKQLSKIHQQEKSRKNFYKKVDYIVIAAVSLVLLGVLLLNYINDKDLTQDSNRSLQFEIKSKETTKNTFKAEEFEADNLKDKTNHKQVVDAKTNNYSIKQEAELLQKGVEEEYLLKDQNEAVEEQLNLLSIDTSSSNMEKNYNASSVPVEELKEEKLLVIDNCDKVKELQPKFNVEKPCFGGKKGAIQFISRLNNDVEVLEYSIDGGENIYL